MRNIFFIAGKDLRHTLKAREAIVWIFVMPIVFFFFIGTVTGGFAPGPGARKDRLAVQVGDDAGFLVDQLLARLEDQGYAVVRPDSAFESYSRRLTVPASFTDSVLAGTQVTLGFAHESDGIGGDYDAIRVRRAAYTMLADLIVALETGATPTPETLQELRDMPRALTLEVKPAGTRRRIPTGFEQAIPGTMVMFTLLVMATSGAILLLIERREGLLRRLAYTPIGRLEVVLGKWAGKWGVGLVQIAFAMIAGTVLFKMNWGPNLAAVIVVMLIYGALMAALGIVLGSIARSERQAIATGVIAANVLGALGGCWWPIEITPDWMQALQLCLPTGWAMDAIHKLVSFGLPPASVLPHVFGMLAATAVLIGVSARVFRFE